MLYNMAERVKKGDQSSLSMGINTYPFFGSMFR